MKKTNKLTKRQVLAIPSLLKKKSVGGIAKRYGVSWQAVWYWIKKLRQKGIECKTQKRGSKSILS